MATVKVYNQEKQETGNITLAPEVFEIEARPEILNFVVRSQMAANRSGTHSVKTRGMVSGGGVKPWKQKGTGRARAGSNRSPIWRGGAIIFGPQPRKYGFKVNRKIRALAVKMALSSKLGSGNLIVMDKIDLEQPKTRFFAKIAKDMEFDKSLIVLPDENANITRASSNVPGITTTIPGQLNAWQILKHKQLVLIKDAIPSIVQRFMEVEEEHHE